MFKLFNPPICSRLRFRPLILSLLCWLPAQLTVCGAEQAVTVGELPKIPPTEPANALGTFRVKPGFHLDIAAAEPLVMDPVAMAFDESGRLFVVEMRDYSERRDEHLGRIRLLEDTDGDGHFDKSTVFAENLPWPTAVICWNGGIFVGATPDIIFLKDTNGDGKADEQRVVFTGFGNKMDKLNVQQLLNSFTWGFDSRIHGATGGNVGVITTPSRPGDKPLELRGRDFSFDPRTLEIRAETGGAQHGMSFDDAGRKFVCSNSAHLQMLMYDEGQAGRNPFYAMPRPLIDIAADGAAAEVYRTSPDEPWRVIRTKWRVTGKVPGLIEGGGRASGYFTAATGIVIYRGDAFPPEFLGDAFVADCGSNLVHRKKLFHDGAAFIGRRPEDEQNVEFITSTDNWFRPVQFANAPDGALYIIDMYRETIEHPWSLPEPLKSRIDLNSGNDRGRIYRILPDGFRQRPLPRLGTAPTEELVRTLAHPNGWHRDTAARILSERQDRAAIAPLHALARDPASPLGRLHALHALASLGALNNADLLAAAADGDPRVRENAVRLLPKLLSDADVAGENWQSRLQSVANDPDMRVRYQTALALGVIHAPEKAGLLAAIAARDSTNSWVLAAILNAAANDAMPLLTGTAPTAAGNSRFTPAFRTALIELIAARSREDDLMNVLGFIDQPAVWPPGERFQMNAAFATALRAKGKKPVPPQVQERIVQSARDATAAALLTTAEDAGRVAALRFAMSVLPWSEARSPLLKLADANTAAVQSAALSSLCTFPEREASDVLVRRWPQLAPRLRAEYLSATLARPTRVPFLLDAIEANQVRRSDLSSTQIEQLRSHRDPALSERAGRLFPKASGSRDAIVASFQGALDLDGNTARGRKVFTERCASCHRLGQEGQTVGPDLASARASGKAKMLASIIDPNREVPPNFFNYEIELKSGDTVNGIITTESEASLTLRRAFGEETVVQRANIAQIRSTGLSLMPEGLEASLTPQDLADLMEAIVMP
jgi:putative membrane-bound dehydrogenase-like protein